MQRARRVRRAARGLIVTSVVILAAGLMNAQVSRRPGPATGGPIERPWNPTSTPDGHPDLQGVWFNGSATPLERPDALAGRARLTDAEVRELQARADRLFKSGNNDFAPGDAFFTAALTNPAQYENPNSTCGAHAMIDRTFENRTSLIVDPPDGKVPALTPDGRRRFVEAAAAAVRSDPDGPEAMSNHRRCLAYGTPRLGDNIYSYFQIVQTRDHVVLNMEYYQEARIIPLAGRPHLPPRVRRWTGDSRGRWDGRTLVVDTTNFSPGSSFRGSAENLQLVERFTRVAADTMTYEVTVTDPTTWTRPWTFSVPLTRTEERLFEVACHEGNHYTVESALAVGRAAETADRR